MVKLAKGVSFLGGLCPPEVFKIFVLSPKMGILRTPFCSLSFKKGMAEERSKADVNGKIHYNVKF